MRTSTPYADVVYAAAEPTSDAVFACNPDEDAKVRHRLLHPHLMVPVDVPTGKRSLFGGRRVDRRTITAHVQPYASTSDDTPEPMLVLVGCPRHFWDHPDGTSVPSVLVSDLEQYLRLTDVNMGRGRHAVCAFQSPRSFGQHGLVFAGSSSSDRTTVTFSRSVSRDGTITWNDGSLFYPPMVIERRDLQRMAAAARAIAVSAEVICAPSSTDHASRRHIAVV